jgi:hypothetical protein
MSKRKKYGADKTLPTICKKCAWRAAADPEAAAEVQQLIKANEGAGAILWEVLGRAMQDAYGTCPGALYGKPLPQKWCELPDGKYCQGFKDHGTLFNCGDELRNGCGDKAHTFWKCWSNYIASEMLEGGKYNLAELNEKIKLLKDKRDKGE